MAQHTTSKGAHTMDWDNAEMRAGWGTGFFTAGAYGDRTKYRGHGPEPTTGFLPGFTIRPFVVPEGASEDFATGFVAGYWHGTKERVVGGGVRNA